MKKNILFVLVFISASAFAQDNDSMATTMFNRGLQFYKEGKLDSSADVWTELVNKKIGLQNNTYGNAFFNIPTVYWEMGKPDKAKEWYKKIIASDLKDNDETGDIMEPHTNYKHKSALALAGLYNSDSNYSEALKWLGEADTVYRYWGFEGSADNINEEEEYLLRFRVNLLLKSKQKDEAIRSIIIELICAGSFEDEFGKSEDTLLSIIVAKKQMKTDLDIALENLKLRTLDSTDWIASFNLDGLEYDIPIGKVYPNENLPHYWRKYFVDENQVVDKKYIVSYIKDRTFYKRLAN